MTSDLLYNDAHDIHRGQFVIRQVLGSTCFRVVVYATCKDIRGYIWANGELKSSPIYYDSVEDAEVAIAKHLLRSE